MFVKFFKIVSLCFLPVLMLGCKTSEEKLIDVCISKLERELSTWAKYGGWSTNDIEGSLYAMTPATDMNEKYKTEQFYYFDVMLTNFTVKNGFNTDVKSYSSCTGHIGKQSDGNYDPPLELLVNVTLNGKKLGL